MRLLRAALALAFLVAGGVFSALNSDPVSLDFHFFSLDAGLGVALLCAALLGAVLGGGVVVAMLAWPMSRRLKRLEQPATGQQPRAPGTP